MYRWLLYGHLLGVGLLVLGTGAYWLATEALRRDDDPAGNQGLLHLARRGTHVVLAGAVALVGFGVGLAVHANLLTQPWILASLGLIGLQGINGRLLAEQPLRHMMHSEPADAPAPVDRAAARQLNAGARASLPILAELELLMTVKPTVRALAWSLAAALALAAFLGWTSLRAPRETTPQHSRP